MWRNNFIRKIRGILHLIKGPRLLVKKTRGLALFIFTFMFKKYSNDDLVDIISGSNCFFHLVYGGCFQRFKKIEG